MFYSTFFYKEKDYLRAEEQYPFIKSLVTCLKNRNFLIFEAISFSVTFIQTTLMMGLSYYFEATQVNLLFCYIAMFVGIIFGMFLWMKPGTRWGIKKSIVLMCVIFASGLTIMLLFGQFTIAGVIGFFSAGIGFSVGMYMVPLMNGDVIDYDEHLSGLRREGMYAGVNSFICKPAISIANAVFPLMLTWFGYDTTISIAEQTDVAKFGIRFSWLFLSVVFLFISAFCIKMWYSLDGEKWQNIKDKLTKIHAEKQIAFEQEMLSKHNKIN